MASRSKSDRGAAFIARAERAGFPSVSMMAVPHASDVDDGAMSIAELVEFRARLVRQLEATDRALSELGSPMTDEAEVEGEE